MTRAEIRAKHGITVIESPEVANKQLSEVESKRYENMIVMMKNYFSNDYEDDDNDE